MSRLFLALLFIVSPLAAQAFCGFYVSRDDGALYNEASRVVFTRNGSLSTITMSSDYKGQARDFAMVVPTPKVLERDQIRTVDPAIITHLDSYTAPRLVEYFDADPCAPLVEPMVAIDAATGRGPVERQRGPAAFGVSVAAQYQVGIYDIIMLKARESDGLIDWLRQEGYNIPDGGAEIVQKYIDDGMKFFVARVNLKRHAAAETQDLQPLQIRFRSPMFMLPIQLGKVNSTGAPQDLLLYVLTNTGRVDLANYPVKRIPTDIDVPVFVEQFFPQFYRDMFNKLAPKSGAFLEYAWDMAWCDPCAANPLSAAELKALGARWLTAAPNAGQDVFVTRLHVRYGKGSFPQDLMLRQTGDRDNFQGRYVMNQPFEGEITCEAGRAYVARTRARIRSEARELRGLTDWSMASINQNIAASLPARYR